VGGDEEKSTQVAWGGAKQQRLYRRKGKGLGEKTRRGKDQRGQIDYKQTARLAKKGGGGKGRGNKFRSKHTGPPLEGKGGKRRRNLYKR